MGNATLLNSNAENCTKPLENFIVFRFVLFV